MFPHHKGDGKIDERKVKRLPSFRSSWRRTFVIWASRFRSQDLLQLIKSSPFTGLNGPKMSLYLTPYFCGYLLLIDLRAPSYSWWCISMNVVDMVGSKGQHTPIIWWGVGWNRAAKVVVNIFHCTPGLKEMIPQCVILDRTSYHIFCPIYVW